jgi:hypothetical protein
MSAPRGQAIVELALGILVLVPMVLFGFYLLDASNEKLVVTGIATDALWSTTAYSHHTYESASFHSPSAAASSQALIQGTYKPRSRLFVAEKNVSVTCSGGGGVTRYTVPATASFYQDLGGARCGARLSIEAKFLPSAFLDQNPSGFFQAPLSQIRRAFTFCETDSCSGFPMMVDDWGLTLDNNEAEECEVSMALTGVCKNTGYFRGGDTVYAAHRTGAGTLSTADYLFVQGVLQTVPKDLERTKDYQMSFRGEDSFFTEDVKVSEGRPNWETTPYTSPWQDSHGMRKEDFLGR